MGSGANNTARYVGSAIGTSVIAVISTRPCLPPGPAGLLSGFDTALIVSAVFSLLGALAVLTCRPRHTSPSEATVDDRPSAPRQRQCSRGRWGSTVTGNRD
jgi:hypothetical protein